MVSDYCYGQWKSQKYCLKNEQNFLQGFQQFITELNQRRQGLFQIQIEAINYIVKNGITEQNSKEILGENSYMLYPLLLDILILRFKKIYSKCYENLNKKILDIFCYLVTETQQEFFQDENNQKFALLSSDYFYEITKNCLETFRGYCLIIKYLKYRSTLLNQQTLFDQIIPHETQDSCDNRLVACVSDYSDKNCDDNIKKEMLLNLLNSNGLVGENQLEELINYYLYGQGNTPTKKSSVYIKFKEQQTGSFIPLQNPTIIKDLNLQINYAGLMSQLFNLIFIIFFGQIILINIMKFEISTFIFLCLFNINLSTLIVNKQKDQKRKLAKTEDNKVVYKIQQDPITREMNIEKVFDSRDEKPNQIDNSPNNFEYDKNEEDKFIYRENPHLQLQVGDLQKVPKMMETLREDVQKRIFLDIKTPDHETKFQRSSVFYKKLPIIKQNYYLFRKNIEQNISKIRQIVDFAQDYIQNTASSGLKDIFVQSDIELDDYNKEVVRQLFEKLIPQVEQLWDLILNDMRESFEEVEKTYENEYESQQSKAETLIRNSLKLMILEKEITEDYFNSITNFSSLIKNNDHYHHLADVFEQSLDFGASEANDPENQQESVIQKIENSFMGHSSLFI